MRGNYRCMFYIDNRYTEEIVFALNNFAAKALIEARYSGGEVAVGHGPTTR